MEIFIDNLTGKGSLMLRMTHKGEEVKLTMSPLIVRENIKKPVGGLNSLRQFEPITVYLNKMGLEDKAFAIYSSLTTRIMDSIGTRDNNVMEQITNELLALFDFDHLCKFIVNDLGREPLTSLPVRYEDSTVITGFGSKEQTYLQHEYIELCALITMFKLILPPIIHYLYLHATGSKDKKSYDAMQLIANTSIMSLPPVTKLKGLIGTLRATSVTSDDIQVTLNNCIAKDDILELVFGALVVGKLMTSSFLEDTNNRHIIKVLHGKASKMLSPGKGSGYVTIGKEASVDNSDENALSVLENIRVASKLTLGYIEEFNYIFTDGEMIALQHARLGIPYNEVLWSEVYNNMGPLENTGPTDLSLEIISWVLYEYGNMFNPEAIESLSMRALRGAITLVTILFINKDMLKAAMFVSAIRHYGGNNPDGSKSTIGEDKLSLISDLCYGDQLCKAAINRISKDSMAFMYMQTLPDRFLLNNDRIMSLPRSIRIDLADILIFAHRIQGD